MSIEKHTKLRQTAALFLGNALTREAGLTLLTTNGLTKWY
jgi:hypothetical protein